MFVTKKKYNKVLDELVFTKATLNAYEEATAKEAKKSLAKLNKKAAKKASDSIETPSKEQPLEVDEVSMESAKFSTPINKSATDRAAKAKEMAATGSSVDEIAIVLNVTNRTVKKYLAK